ncbi:hypothetical protein JET14_21000 (plasmid) [Martelella lutilitoris]|uniref:Uncharacterized protein n=1 Tax=Martelella lutilitoris TaxID=2583532 RepID=A0A7T7HPB9_9HYPH|nr:hypothetical protein [Martelella lutilitoris]QQM32918.1 hypothetical protein JET14_21000 [Martelella lutilitoris]
MKQVILCLSAFSLGLASVAAHAGYLDALKGHEGGDSYSVINKKGTALGKYQITAGTWATLGYTQGSGGDWSNYTFTDKARAAGVSSLDDLRYSEAGKALQERAVNELTISNWNSMSSQTRGLVGQTVNGVQITQESLLDAAHFLGSGALNDWVASGFDPNALPESYLAANGLSSYAELQDLILKRMASINGNSYDGFGYTNTYSVGGMYGATSDFPGFGSKRPVLIQEVPPYQGEKKTL